MKPIDIIIKAKDQTSGVFDSLKGKVAGLAAALAGLLGFAAFAGAIRGAADLEAKLSEVKAVSGATAEEMKELRAAAEDAGASTKFTAAEAAEALGELARSGLDAKGSIAALPAVLQLATVGKIGLGDAAGYVTKTLAGFVLGADQAGRVADVLAKAADASNTSVVGLAQGLSYAAPVAKGLGLSLEFTAALLGKFADAGIDASRGGTALNAILSQFSDPASRFRQELAAMGITTGNFEQALREMAKAGPGAQKAVLAVGTEAGPALRALMNQGLGALDDLTGKLREAGGSAAATAAQMQDNLVGATGLLGSAWDTVKNKLATPVLPVLKDGVERLTAALKQAVTDGTVTKFGESIAAGFKAGLAWAKEFFGQMDFAALGQRMRTFADEAGATFQQVGEYARNTGNLIQTAYGVMAAGGNAVLIPIYAIGSAFARVAQGVSEGIVLLREAAAKVTFGKLSTSFKEAANDARDMAQGFGDAARAMEDKAAAAFEGMADGAALARAGFDGLTDKMAETDRQSGRSAAVFSSTATALQQLGDVSDAVSRRMRTDTTQQRLATEKSAEAVRQLRSEYQQALDTGNVQLATEKQLALAAATTAVATATVDAKKKAEDAALAIDAAFQRAGIQTKAALKTIATTALQDFEIIKASGQATTDGLRAAWQRYAEAAIAANGGVASEMLKAQASMRGLEISADSTGKAIVRSMDAGAQAAANLTTAVQLTTEQLQAQEDALDRIAMRQKLTADYTERQIALLERENEQLERRAELERKRLGVDREGFSTDKQGNTLAAGGDLTTRTGIAAFLRAAGVGDEAAARKLANEFADSKGNIPYMSNPGQMKYGGANSTMSEALLKAAEQYTFSQDAGQISRGGKPPDTRIPLPERERTVNFNIAGIGRVRTDAEGEATLDQLVSQLQRAAGRMQ